MENLQSSYGDQLSGRPFPTLPHQETQNALHRRRTADALTLLPPAQTDSEPPYATVAGSRRTEELRDPRTHTATAEDLRRRSDGENRFLVSGTPAAASQSRTVQFQPSFDSNTAELNTPARPSRPHPNHHLQKLIKPVPLFTDIHPSFPVPYVMPHLNALWPVLVPHVINASVPHQNPFCPIYTPPITFTPPFTSNLSAFAPPVDPACSCRVFQPHTSLSVHPNTGRAASGGPRRHSSGDAETAGRGGAVNLIPDLAERALSEYTQVMEALGSEVSRGSEVTADEEEDVCALYLNQLFTHHQMTTEPGFDMDSINSLLSTDVLRDDSQDMFPGVIPEPAVGRSDWTTQILSSSALRCDFSPSDGTRRHSAPDQIPVWSQTSAVLPEPPLADPEGRSASVPETVHPAPHDSGPETEGDTSSQRDEASFVTELHPVAQSDESHRSTFTRESPGVTRVEDDGEERTAVRQRAEKQQDVSSDSSDKNTDIPNHSQTTGSSATHTNDSRVNKNNTYKTHRGRRKHQKITTSSEDKDKRDSKTQRERRRRPETKHGAGETPLAQTNPAHVTSSARDRRKGGGHDGQIRDTRAEHLDEELERRQRRVRKTRTHKGGATHEEQRQK